MFCRRPHNYKNAPLWALFTQPFLGLAYNWDSELGLRGFGQLSRVPFFRICLRTRTHRGARRRRVTAHANALTGTHTPSTLQSHGAERPQTIPEWSYVFPMRNCGIDNSVLCVYRLQCDARHHRPQMSLDVGVSLPWDEVSSVPLGCARSATSRGLGAPIPEAWKQGRGLLHSIDRPRARLGSPRAS
jgi:hypothetical protein